MKTHNFEIKSYWTYVDKIVSTPIIALNESGDIVGSCILHCSAFSALMQDLHVAENYRRLGVASFMLNKAIENVKIRYIESLTIQTGYAEAKLFFENHGFFVCDECQDSLTMTKRIGAK